MDAVDRAPLIVAVDHHVPSGQIDMPLRPGLACLQTNRSWPCLKAGRYAWCAQSISTVLPYVKYMYLGLTELINERYDETVQRLRLMFSRGQELRYISHLDLMRLWERSLRRGEIPLAYSEGYSPHPRLSLAAPLPIGVTSEAELMDVIVNRSASAHFVMRNVRQQLPRGLGILELAHVPLAAPSLQSQVRYAEYRVAVVADKNAEEIRTDIGSLLRTGELH